ncbi:RNA-directed DNA polymerase from mobile element jockey-like [Brachionus plicatilis]|uniref:RNA-directed DNA polymerase from mobile element jockey-like n=1 Tax=Brachionus plicatilis TaxID=10195 RepID=A0A3M7QK55_BRAPC|nr:RNA-directed DNA polymerase from mobile element jockey-like [Brachionus plicatilis]
MAFCCSRDVYILLLKLSCLAWSSSSSVCIELELVSGDDELEPSDFLLMTLRADLDTNLVSLENENRFADGLCCLLGLNFNVLVDEIKERCNKRLNIIKILSNKKWGLNQNTLGNFYKSLVGSILDYSFPCLNSFSENNIKKLQAIQNTAVRSFSSSYLGKRGITMRESRGLMGVLTSERTSALCS